MKTKKRNRCLVIFLSFLVCISLMPMTAFAGDNSAPEITNGDNMPYAVVGKAYEYQFNAISEGAVTWEKNGIWSSWLQLDSSTGRIYGTPTTAQNVSTGIIATCIDSDGVTRTDAKNFKFTVYPRPEIVAKKGRAGNFVDISGTSLPDATQNSEYLGVDEVLFIDENSYSIRAMNIEGVPIGMNALNGGSFIELNGRPTNAGTYSIKVSLSTYVDYEKTKLIGTTEKTFTLKVNPDGSTPQEEVTVTFDKNGGSGTMADVTVNKGSNYTLPDCTFTAPTGKEFKAWEVDGAAKAVGDSIAVNANTTAKALWKDKLITNYTVTVTDGTADKVTAQEGDTVTITANAAPSGQVFAGWEIVFGKFAIEDMTAATTTLTIGTTNVEIKARYNPAPAEDETYTVMVASPISNGSVSVDNDTELWEGDTITITVAPDMGYELSELIAKDDDENSISITKVSDTEYTFDMPAANVRVNATFKEKTGGTVMPQTSTITINPNGGKWADNTTTAKIFEVQVGNTFTIPEAPKRDGYTFLYWEGSRYNPGEQYLVTALDHTFTAVWQKNEVKPTNNENTSSENTNKEVKTSPKTGDNGMLYVYTLELLMAASGMLILHAKRNKKSLK